MTTRTDARRAILRGTGRGGVFTTTGAGSTSAIVCTDWKSTLLPTDHFRGVFLHVPTATAPRQRRGAATGLDNTTGTIAVDDVYGSSIGTATAVEWCPTPIISAAATGNGPSLEDNLYEALRHLVFEDQVSVAIATTSVISLATWANWLDRDQRINWTSPGGAFLEPAWVSGGELVDASYRGITFELDGETPQIRLAIPYGAASGNLTIKVLRPADTWFKTSGTWAENAPGTGLAAESDECKPDLRHCREAGLVFYYMAQAARVSGAMRDWYQQQYEAQLAIARALPFWDHTRDTLLPRPGQPAQQQEAA